MGLIIVRWLVIILLEMKLRTQRVHYMGSSNRETEMPALPTKNVFESSYIKSQSSYYKTAQSLPSQSEILPSKTKDPHQGTHFQQETLRWNSKAKRSAGQSQWKLEQPVPKLDYTYKLNEEIMEVPKQFEGKDINLFKLNELKRTFIKNNHKRRNIKDYFDQYSKDGKVGIEEIQKIVKEYGYDVNADEAKLIFKLTGNKGQGLAINEFVELMTKDNVHFRTLKIPGNDGKGRKYFEERVHLVFRNKFNLLKEAFRIYRMCGEDIDENKFNYVMKKLDINDLVVSKAERNNLFERFKEKDGNFNVERLLCAIVEQQHTKKPTYPPRLSDFDTNLKANQQAQAKQSKKPNQYDFKRMSNLQYENQFQKAQTVLNQIKKLGTVGKELFDKTDGSLKREELRQKLEGLLQKKGINFNKEEYDIFTSYLDYNSNNVIKSEHFKKFIEQTPESAQERFDRRVRAFPPESTPPSEIFDENTALDSLERVKGKKLAPEMRVLFHEFDVDKDGYVSREQLKSKLNKLAVLEHWQVQNLANYFDPAGKGYVNYSEFAEKYTNSQKEFQNAVKEPINKLKSQSDWINTKRSFIKDANTCTYNVPSKYSAWPERLKRTDFSMIQPPSKAGQYASEQQRFNLSEKHNLAQQYKQERNRVYENRLRKLVAWNEQNQQRIENKTWQEEKRAQANDYSMRLTKQTYEEHCRNNN